MSTTLGTILPTAASIAATNRHYRQVTTSRAAVERRELVSKGYRREICYPEDRFYATDKTFAIVGRDCKIRWFEHRADGHVYFLSWTKPAGV